MPDFVSRHPDFAAWAELAFARLVDAYRRDGREPPLELTLFLADVRSFRMSHDSTQDATSAEDADGMKMTIDEAAASVGVTRRTIHRWIDDGLASERRGRYRFVARAALDAFTEARGRG